MSKVQVTGPEKEFKCDFCDNPDTIATITGPETPDMELCRACAMDMMHKLKTKITNDLLGISDED